MNHVVGEGAGTQSSHRLEPRSWVSLRRWPPELTRLLSVETRSAGPHLCCRCGEKSGCISQG